MQLVVHAPFGARINRAWGLALRKRFCRAFNLELQAAATDNGLVISLTEQHAFPLELVFEFLRVATLEHTLTQALLASPMFASRWRWNVSRALAVPRFSGGRKVPPPIQRMRSDDLMAAVFPDQAACAENLTGEIRIPEHPYVKETIDNCLHEAMDLNGLRALVARLEAGEIRTVAIETAEPSPFSHEILNANPYAYLDDAPLEERRARAVQMRRSLSPEMLDGPAALDADAVARVADELHDALLTLVTLPPVPEWEEFHEVLCRDRRATTLWVEGSPLWVAAERLSWVGRLHADAERSPEITAVDSGRAAPESREAAAAEILRGWLDSTVPATAAGLAARLSLPHTLVEAGLARLEAEGQILRGRFAADEDESGEKEPQWANRRLLARIHRLTLGRLRREIEPVSSADFMRFLLRWQHATLGGRLHGMDGLLQVIRQLQGYEIPATAWESQILPRRIVDYKPELLDRLCLAGEVTWGRLSPHPAFNAASSGTALSGESEEAPRSRRVRPTRVAPIALFLREDAEWLLKRRTASPDPDARASLSHPAREVLAALESRGASFFADLVRTSARLPSEVEDGLWELAAAGFVSADGFENLRALTDPKRRRGEGRGRHARPRHAAGRWALLKETAAAVSDADAEKGNADAVAAFARQLLTRWGVIFRDMVRRETLAPSWRDLLVVLRRMEARGEIRGGRFASAFVGEQFALPEAVELLRSVRRTPPAEEEVVLGAADPLNLVGVVLPGRRVSSSATERVRLRNGVPVETDAPSAESADQRYARSFRSA